MTKEPTKNYLFYNNVESIKTRCNIVKRYIYIDKELQIHIFYKYYLVTLKKPGQYEKEKDESVFSVCMRWIIIDNCKELGKEKIMKKDRGTSSMARDLERDTRQ